MKPGSGVVRLAILLLLIAGGFLAFGEPADSERSPYEEPKLLTGTIYEKGQQSNRVLFTFRRTATLSNSTVRVLREYFSEAGLPTARERVLYEKDRLISYEVEELQTGAKGRALLGGDPQNPKSQTISFQYMPRTGAKNETGKETARKDVLINDMLPHFLVSHWDELMKGIVVKFRFIVLSRTETVGFKLVKESETRLKSNNQAVVTLRMEPGSVIIAKLVQPIHFTVEKSGAHRIIQYTGRTTPLIKRGNKWEALDALTVFDWK